MTTSTRRRKLYEKILRKRCKNVRFEDLCSLLEMYDWVLDRIARNSHYIYVHSDYEGIVNVPRPHDSPHVKSPYCRDALLAIQEVMGYDD
jgi:predicted RNA binding protein YcfA (HicA-like mRNA interferase family)